MGKVARVQGASVNHVAVSDAEILALNAHIVPKVRRVPWLAFLDRLSDADANDARAMIDGLNAKQGERLKREGIPANRAGVRAWLTGRGYNPDEVLK